MAESVVRIRSLPTLVAGVTLSALGLSVVVAEATTLSFGQSASLLGLVGALAVLAGALVRARQQDPLPPGAGPDPGVPIGTGTADRAPTVSEPPGGPAPPTPFVPPSTAAHQGADDDPAEPDTDLPGDATPNDDAGPAPRDQ